MATIDRNDPCWCGSGIKWKKCHYPQSPPNDSSLKETYRNDYNILLKSPEEIEGIRKACHLASKILDNVCARAKIGVTTLELNDLAHRLHLEAGAIPAPLNYGQPPFPKSICTSINEVICHGIPDQRPLIEGDILNIDVTCIYQGFFGDCSRMVYLGEVTPEKKLVVETAYECLMKAIQGLRPGVPISAIGEAITAHAHARGCSVVRDFVGHGVGLRFHENPQIPHCRNKITTPLAPGMTFTIEPMINAGVAGVVVDRHDKWTARTADGKPSAQWEHTLLITDSGYEILTNWRR